MPSLATNSLVLPSVSMKPDPGILSRNLQALGRSSPATARLVQRASPAESVRFLQTDSGHLAAEVGEGDLRRALCSRRNPRREAAALVDPIDIADSAVFLVSGFGCGYHVEALARRLNRTGVIVVYEPDLALLRAVLERIDCSEWLGALNVAVMHDAADSAELARIVEGIEGLVAMGVTLVEHPASRERIGDRTRELHARFLDVVKAVKMTVITTMMQVRTTFDNLLANLDRYVASPGVGELAGACAGRQAIVVSAGPSLQRNIALLEDPAVRDRFVIVAVQTVLKPLLARGIRPHFVTALDYSAISARFYEGLTAHDVEGVTLVVDPKVNPAVLAAWPREAALRVQSDKHLDKLLGPDLARDKGALPAGATVAHLAYYLARHLGCDPVSLIGQDLGFTDGQYYSAGAAIHNVWAAELNEFNTLEMLEWQRILRMGAHLRKTVDILDRPIYTDEQMATYLMQFERDFKADAERGLTTIDATEGGVRKLHTRVQPLHAVIDAHRGSNVDGQTIDALLAARSGARRVAPPSLRAVRARVGRVAADTRTIAGLSRDASIHIAELLEHQADRARADRLIAELERLAAQAAALQPAFDLTQTLNQTGVFNRLRADRALQIESNQGALSPMERQRRQLERDAENVRTLAESAADLAALLERHPGASAVAEAAPSTPPSHEVESSTAVGLRCAAVLPIFGPAHHLAATLVTGRTVLGQTIHQLSNISALRSAPLIIAAEDPAGARAAIVDSAALEHIEIVPLPRSSSAFLARRAGVRVARAFARDCWRGGLANQSVYDEVFDPSILRDLAARFDLDAVLLAGPDWSALDPALCNDVIQRHASNPAHSRFTFTQAPPGLAACLLSRSLLDDFAAGAEHSGVFASIGGLLGYIPFTPIVDLINLPECVAIPPELRDLGDGRRFIADTRRGRTLINARLNGETSFHVEPPPVHLTLELISASGPGHEVRRMNDRLAQESLQAFITALGDEPGTLTLSAADPLSGLDPLDHPACLSLITAAARAGMTVHLRTPLTSHHFNAAELMSGAPHIISIDLLAESASGFAEVTGRDAQAWVIARERLDTLIAARTSPWALPWIVPRLTRCDAAYAEMDAFYRPRIIQCGAAVIDPLPASSPPVPGARIAPLPLPAVAQRRFLRSRRTIGVDGVSRP